MKRFRAAVVLASAAALAACDKSAPAPQPPAPAPAPAGDPRADFAAGEDALRRGRLDEALRRLRAALAADPSFMPAWLRYQEAMHAAGKGEDLLADVRARAAGAPGDPHWSTVLAACEKSGSLDRLDAVVRATPGFAWAHYVRAGRLFAEARFEEALRAADRAVQLDTENGLFRFMKGIALSKAGKVEECVSELRRAAELLPADERPRVALAEVLLDAERTEEAVAELEAAIKLAPAAESPRAVLRDLRVHQARLALREYSEHAGQEHWGAAAEAAERAARTLAPVVAEDAENAAAARYLANAETACGAAWMGRATASSREGKLDDVLGHAAKAAEWLASARARKPSDKDAREYLAQAHLRLGAILMSAALDLQDKGNAARAGEELRRALAAFEGCLEIDPENRTAAGKAAEIRKLLEK